MTTNRKDTNGKTLISILSVLLITAAAAVAQDSEPDPAIQEAKEETAVVYDLGRFFGYVSTLETDTPSLALSGAQLTDFHDIMAEIQDTERIEPDWAEDTLEYLELDVLTPKQLMEVDQLALARTETQESGTGTQRGGGGTGSGPLQTYVAGGAFNPIIDQTKSIGQGFFKLFESISGRLNR